MAGKCPCAECNYFNGINICGFLKRPTKPENHCFAEFYESIPMCNEQCDCRTCQYLFNGCLGDKNRPARTIKVNPHDGQKAMFKSNARITALLWGAQSGKTLSGAAWMSTQMKKFGYGDYLAVSSSFPLLEKKLQPTYIDFFENVLDVGKFKAKKNVIEVNGGGLEGTIFFGSAKNPESLESATALAAHLDEAGQDVFTRAAWEAIRRRLSRNQGNILITTTLYNFGWLKTEIYDKWATGDPDINVIHFDSINSPGFSKVEWENLKRDLPLWKFNMQMRGIFSRPAGQIYSEFSDTHIIDPFPIPQSWNWHVGIDPGSVHTAFVWVAESPEKKYYIVRSYLDGNKTTKEHVAKAKRFSEFGRVIRWVGGASNEDQFRMDWKVEGIHVREPEIRDVEAGIDRVTALLKENRLFIFNGENDENQELIEEFRSYSRRLDDNGQPTDKIEGKHKYHLLDGARYLFVGIGTTGDYSTPVEMQESHIPTLYVNDDNVLRDEDVPQF